MTLSKAEQAKALVENPDRFNEFIGDHSNEFEYYRAVRNAAPHELDSFEEYLKLHQIFFETESGEKIKSKVEEWLPRSIKNMVIGTSKRGKAYSLDTLSEVQLRHKLYNDLGVSTPTLYQQSQTIIEALYDLDWEKGYDVVSNLLDDYPDNTANTVELLARLRVILGVQESETPMQALQSEVEHWVQITEIPLDESPETAQECIEEAATLRYEKPRKTNLYAAAVHLDSARTDAFLEYLYLTARNIIEQYRHSNESPERAMLGVGELQFTQLREYDDFLILPYREKRRTEWYAWIDSYIEVTEGILLSEGRFHSGRENWPSTDFSKAAHAYLRAANHVQDFHPMRCAKYTSKAFRHAENATQNWESSQTLHDYAISYLLDFSTQSEYNTGGNQTQLQSLIRYHRFKRTELAIRIHFRENEYQNVVESYYEYIDLMENLHQPKEVLADLDIKNKYQLSEARIAETDENYESAIGFFDHLKRVENKPKNIEQRAAFCHLKKYISSNQFEDALEVAEIHFQQDQLAILSATKLICGDELVELSSSHDDLFLPVISERIGSIAQLVALSVAGANSKDSNLIDFLRSELLNS